MSGDLWGRWPLIVATAFGTASGVLALGYGWWGDPHQFVRLAGPPDAGNVVTIVAIHAIATTSIIGGIVLAQNISIGRSILLASAVAWLSLAAILGGGVTPPLAIATLLAAAGGLVALLAGRSSQPSQMGVLREPARPSKTEPATGQAGPRSARDDRSSSFVPPMNTGAARKTNARAAGEPKRRARGVRRSGWSELRIGIGAVILFVAAASILIFFVWTAGDPNVARTSSRQVSLSETAPKDERLSSSAASVSPSEERFVPRSSESSSAPLPSVPQSPSSEVGSQPSSEFQVLSPPPLSGVAGVTPAQYCASAGDIDTPNLIEVTDGIDELQLQVTGTAASDAIDFVWRCMDRAVWTCTQFAGERKCDKVPTAAERVIICSANPDAAAIRTAGGVWRCDGFTPVVTADQLAPPDKRGFDRAVWQKLQ